LIPGDRPSHDGVRGGFRRWPQAEAVLYRVTDSVRNCQREGSLRGLVIERQDGDGPDLRRETATCEAVTARSD
jgi:hypothetical protein